ncbi:rabankyrin-5, partial [Octopus sinensis]|uniref:Rabankyrin-5 n=1 Tax=Octopus sinensis TaxID=2607531 RepID=A0A6P7TQ94_9MOLL
SSSLSSTLQGETALHIACTKGLAPLVKVLLERGANPNAQTAEVPQSTTSALALYTEVDEDGNPKAAPVGKQTPLHLAIIHKYEEIVSLFLEHKAKHTASEDTTVFVPNFNLKDSEGQSVLGLALWNGLHGTAVSLLSAGANINETNVDQMTLLHQALDKQDVVSALFLLDHQADISIPTPEGDAPLQLAIKRHLPVIVEALCASGVNMNIVDKDNNCPLWLALDSGQEDIAHILVKHGCDVDMWGEGPDGCQQNLLHQAIDENNEAVSCFLIRSACDKNSPRRPGPNEEGGEEARDGQTPLHLSCAWGLELVVQCLMEHGADVNIQDAEGNCPLHIAIQNQHAVIISLLLAHPNLNLSLKNKQGLSPFAVAMTTKDNKAAQAILNREPTAAEQTDNKGRNFLHTAIMNGDIESVLFLISVHADVNSRVQDTQQYTPLHLAVLALSEIITRNLILAGADVNERTLHGESALHLSSMNDNPSLVTALLENGVEINAVDENQNNALHIAVAHGNMHTIRCLLTESTIEAEVPNGKGQNPLHILCQYGKDNAAAIFELFREAMPDYPIDAPDMEGNSALLLAYLNGNGPVCRALVRANACLGLTNKHGCSIFNATVASKQLIFKLLDMLSKEPPWCDGENCLECGVKFGIKTRKHHCRHCGRLLCAKCSTHDIPIVKYNLTKPVRVCNICFDVLSLGGNF